MSETLWQALIAAAVTLILGLMSQRNKWAVDRTKVAVDDAASNAVKTAKTVAVKVEEVKQTAQDSVVATAAKLDALAEVTGKTHGLVNGGTLSQLRRYAAVARRLADLTRMRADCDEAEAAEKELADAQSKGGAK